MTLEELGYARGFEDITDKSPRRVATDLAIHLPTDRRVVEEYS